MLKKLLLVSLSILMIITSSAFLFNSNAVKTGWKEEKGNLYYYNSKGKKVTGWNKIGGDKFYMGSDGAVRTKWQKINSKTYFFRPSDNNGHKKGSMVTGKAKINGTVYVFSSNGVLQKVEETTSSGGISSKIKPKTVSGKTWDDDGYTQTITLDGKTFKLYKQGCGPWAGKHYNSCSNISPNGTYGNTGCGPSATAIILSGYKSSVTPPTVGRLCMKNSTPSNLPSLKQAVLTLGLKCKLHYYSSNYTETYNQIRKSLVAGRKIVLYVGQNAKKSDWENFTKSGFHFISILGIDKANNKAFVGNSSRCSSGWYNLETIVKARGNTNGKMAGWIEIYK